MYIGKDEIDRINKNVVEIEINRINALFIIMLQVLRSGRNLAYLEAIRI